MNHDKAIEAARLAMRADDLDPTVEEVARAIAAFLRAWAAEIQGWDTATPSNLYFAANLEIKADDLEGKE